MFLYSGDIDDELGQRASKVFFNVTLMERLDVVHFVIQGVLKCYG